MAMPSFSVMIGIVYGSHSAMRSPGHLGALVGEQPRAIRHAVPRLLAAGLIEQHELAIAAHHHRHAGRVDDDVAVLDLHRGVERRLDRGLLGAALRRAADVEGAHRQLGAGLADRLGGDDADRLADIDDRAAREVAPIALAADADRASQVRTERIDTASMPALSIASTASSSIRAPAGSTTSPAERVEDIDRGAAAEDAVGERRNDLAAVDDGAGHEAAGRAAILLGDDRVLGDVDEAAGQIAGIGGLRARCRRGPCGRRASS